VQVCTALAPAARQIDPVVGTLADQNHGQPGADRLSGLEAVRAREIRVRDRQLQVQGVGQGVTSAGREGELAGTGRSHGPGETGLGGKRRQRLQVQCPAVRLKPPPPGIQPHTGACGTTGQGESLQFQIQAARMGVGETRRERLGAGQGMDETHSAAGTTARETLEMQHLAFQPHCLQHEPVTHAHGADVQLQAMMILARAQHRAHIRQAEALPFQDLDVQFQRLHGLHRGGPQDGPGRHTQPEEQTADGRDAHPADVRPWPRGGQADAGAAGPAGAHAPLARPGRERKRPGELPIREQSGGIDRGTKTLHRLIA
jgi:hypothetical protein